MSSTPKKAPKANMDDVHAALQALIAQGKKDGMIRAADLNALGETLAYLSARTALTIDYTTAAVTSARGGVQLTEEGMATVLGLLL